MKYAKPTGAERVNPKLLECSTSNARYDFLIENHKRALKLLPTVQPHQHRQEIYAEAAPENVCGTAACALGWVALTGVCDGLRYSINEYGRYIPNVNGKAVWNWGVAGDMYFGEDTAYWVFSYGEHSMLRILDLLNVRLEELQFERQKRPNQRMRV